MIAVDSSALIAIVLDEPEKASFMSQLKQADRVLVSPATIVEARLVAYRRGGDVLVALLDDLIETFGMAIIPPGPDEIAAAHAAFVAYGKGGGHPAQLNFGDLFSYALAKVRGLPLLFKGDDFGHTDIEQAAA